MKIRIFLSILLILVIFTVFLLSVKLFKIGLVEAVDVGMGAIENPGVRLKNVFKAGESISFGIYSYGIKVGSGSLDYSGTKISGKQNLEHIVFQVTSFSINDREDILGTEDFSYPVKVKRKVRRLGKSENIIEEYAQDHKSVVIRKAVENSKEVTLTIENKNSLQNIILLIYRLRNDRSLKIGSVYNIQLPTQGLVLEVKRKESIKVPLGRIEAFYIESNPAKYRIWLSCDEKRLPVKIRGVVGAGMVYLAAIDVKNL